MVECNISVNWTDCAHCAAVYIYSCFVLRAGRLYLLESWRLVIVMGSLLSSGMAWKWSYITSPQPKVTAAGIRSAWCGRRSPKPLSSCVDMHYEPDKNSCCCKPLILADQLSPQPDLAFSLLIMYNWSKFCCDNNRLKGINSSQQNLYSYWELYAPSASFCVSSHSQRSVDQCFTIVLSIHCYGGKK